jgi:hypothetical protein
MRRLIQLLPIAVTLPSTAFAEENCVPIPIQNPGFEADVLTCGSGLTCDNPKVPAWLPSGFAGTIKPGTGQYPAGVPEGVNVAFLGEPDTSTGSISQTLGATLKANTKYILKLSVGHRADEVFTGYIAALLAGGVTVAFDSSLLPEAGTFLEDVIVFKSPARPLLYGKPLTISIQSIGAGQVNIDNVSLSACSVGS